MKLLITLLSLVVASASMAAPKKTDADNWGQQFKQLRDKSTDALVLRDSVGPARKD
jgi:hypothetical protein